MSLEVELFSHPLGRGPRFRRIAAVLDMLDIGRTKLWRLVKSGDVTAKKVGGTVFIDMVSVAALFDAAPSITPLKNQGTMSLTDLGFDEEPPPLEFRITADDLAGMLDESTVARGESAAPPGGSAPPVPANASAARAGR